MFTIAVAFRCDAVSISRRSGSVFFRFCGKHAIPVYNVQHLVPGSLDLPMQLPERRSAHVVTARIDKNVGVLHIKDGEGSPAAAQGIERCVREHRRDEFHAEFFESARNNPTSGNTGSRRPYRQQRCVCRAAPPLLPNSARDWSFRSRNARK